MQYCCPVVQNIGSNSIGNMHQNEDDCDQSPGICVAGCAVMPYDATGSRLLRPVFCRIPNQRRSESFNHL